MPSSPPDNSVTTIESPRAGPARAAAAVEGIAGRRLLPSSGVSVLLRLIQLGPLLVLAVLWLVLSFASPYFLTMLNVTNLLEATAVVAILALGQLLVILIGGIDLSAGTATALVTVVGATIAQDISDQGLIVVGVMLGTGMLVGLANGVLIEKLKLGTAFVITLGTLSIVQGVAFLISDGATIVGMPELVDEAGSGRLGDIPTSALIVVAFAILAVGLTRGTPWGRWVYAVGGNREAAIRAGIPVALIGVSAFVASGLAAGVAGVFTAGLTDSGAPSGSFTVLLDAIAAVVIGGAALNGGRGSVLGTLIGALILGTIHNGLNLLNVNTSWEPFVLGTVLILAVGLDQLRGRLETRLRLEEARRAGAVAAPTNGAIGGAT